MTEQVLPPPGTPSDTYHWLRKKDGIYELVLWQPGHSNLAWFPLWNGRPYGTTPWSMAANGWSYCCRHNRLMKDNPSMNQKNPPPELCIGGPLDGQLAPVIYVSRFEVVEQTTWSSDIFQEPQRQTVKITRHVYVREVISIAKLWLWRYDEMPIEEVMQRLITHYKQPLAKSVYPTAETAENPAAPYTYTSQSPAV